MSVSSKKIVTLIPCATEIVAFLGEKKLTHPQSLITPSSRQGRV